MSEKRVTVTLLDQHGDIRVYLLASADGFKSDTVRVTAYTNDGYTVEMLRQNGWLHLLEGHRDAPDYRTINYAEAVTRAVKVLFNTDLTVWP